MRAELRQALLRPLVTELGCVAAYYFLDGVAGQVKVLCYLADRLAVSLMRTTYLADGFHYQHLLCFAPLSGVSPERLEGLLRWVNFRRRFPPYVGHYCTPVNTFRRLKQKTQVFLAPKGDHYRTRLTHVLEVAQIARTIARALRLNEDLTEAIALGHDLGHTPFGHAGEEVLDELHPGGFDHYKQSLRVVDVIEKEGRGLNLTHEVRDGILKHSKGRGMIMPEAEKERPATLEGQVVRIADIVAYLNHDLDDAIRAGVVQRVDVPDHIAQVIGKSYAKRIDSMVRDVVQASLIRELSAVVLSEEMGLPFTGFAISCFALCTKIQ